MGTLRDSFLTKIFSVYYYYFSKREDPELNNVIVAQSLSDLAVYSESEFIFPLLVLDWDNFW